MAETLKYAGEIVDLDDDRFTISLRIGKNAPPFPAAFSLIPGQPIQTDVLREAIYRYAEALIASASRYEAITSFLTRRAPIVTGVESRESHHRRNNDSRHGSDSDLQSHEQLHAGSGTARRRQDLYRSPGDS